MKIGVLIPDGFNPKAGGAFSYVERLLLAMDEYEFGPGVTICFVTRDKDIDHSFKKPVVRIGLIPAWLKKIPGLGNLFYQLESLWLKKYGDSIFKKKGLSLMYYTRQGVCLCPKYPFVASNWDIGHCSTYPFPEMNSEKEIKRRRRYYEDILPRAIMVFVDSNSGKEELLRYTRIGDHKIRVFPLFGGSVSNVVLNESDGLRIIKNYGLEEHKFFFYPAQFWAHKNHFNLIKAFAMFLVKHPEMRLVLSGSDKGNRGYIESLINQLNISDKVIFLGFVPIETLYCMYKYSCALVMASHFGPTNMPPIEAMEIGCPVACSDIGGHREILGDAASYFNSFDIASIFNSMTDIIDNNDYYRTKIVERQNKTKYKFETAMPALSQLLSEVVAIRENWK